MFRDFDKPKLPVVVDLFDPLEFPEDFFLDGFELPSLPDLVLPAPTPPSVTTSSPGSVDHSKKLTIKIPRSQLSALEEKPTTHKPAEKRLYSQVTSDTTESALPPPQKKPKTVPDQASPFIPSDGKKLRADEARKTVKELKSAYEKLEHQFNQESVRRIKVEKERDDLQIQLQQSRAESNYFKLQLHHMTLFSSFLMQSAGQHPLSVPPPLPAPLPVPSPFITPNPAAHTLRGTPSFFQPLPRPGAASNPILLPASSETDPIVRLNKESREYR